MFKVIQGVIDRSVRALQQKADAKYGAPSQDDCDKRLRRAVKWGLPDTVAYNLDSGASPHIEIEKPQWFSSMNKRTDTLITWAIERGHMYIARKSIEQGASPNECRKYYKDTGSGYDVTRISPLEMAIQKNSDTAVGIVLPGTSDQILENVCARINNKEFPTPKDDVCRLSHKEIMYMITVSMAQRHAKAQTNLHAQQAAQTPAMKPTKAPADSSLAETFNALPPDQRKQVMDLIAHMQAPKTEPAPVSLEGAAQTTTAVPKLVRMKIVKQKGTSSA